MLLFPEDKSFRKRFADVHNRKDVQRQLKENKRLQKRSLQTMERIRPILLDWVIDNDFQRLSWTEDDEKWLFGLK